jgi:hypothetical protein
MTPALPFRVIEKKFSWEDGDVFFAWNMGMSFFCYAPGRDLACKIWACIVKYRNNITIKTYHRSLVPGQALYILGVCPENRDESNGDNIIKL